MKKKLGIISGMGTRAGMLFIGKLIELSKANSDQEFPEFILHNNSQIPDRTKAIMNGGESPIKELSRSLHLLNQNRVNIIVATCVTSYFFLDQIKDRTSANLLNPVQLVLNWIIAKHPFIKTIGLLATTGTIESKLFHSAFSQHSYQIVTLEKEDQEKYFMQSIYMKNGLKSSQISDQALSLFQKSVSLLTDKKVELIIAACSEAQIGLKNCDIPIPCVDAMDIMAEEIFRQYL